MRRLKRVLIVSSLLVVAPVLTSCGQQAQSDKPVTSAKTSSVKLASYYQRSLEKGPDAVARSKYVKAQAYFENAVDTKPKAKRARHYLTQVRALNQAQTAFDQQDYARAQTQLAQGQKATGSTALTTALDHLATRVKAKQASAIKASQAASSQSSEAASSSATAKSTSSSSKTVSPAEHQQANDLRRLLVSNQGFSASVLKGIPDADIIQAFAGSGDATNAALAASAGKLLQQYPNLK
ncbi:hypothetical protein ACFP3T_09155 [Lactiplantibacillus dongliensis]|uniref:Lipoprotein n=1 Tax=Lactiplantibacillus dongliensis TaxID=2559919 RepID=A0ABW1R4M5_9LACO|nr:hypothetical protein [Lactiplantibacillus dongliensis]